MVLGADIPDGYLVGLVPVFVTAILGLMAWIVRELNRVSITLGRHEERLNDLEDKERPSWRRGSG